MKLNRKLINLALSSALLVGFATILVVSRQDLITTAEQSNDRLVSAAQTFEKRPSARNLGKLTTIAARRHDILAKEIEQNPRAFVNHALPKELRDDLPNEVKPLVETDLKVANASLEVIHFDDFESRKSDIRYFADNLTTKRDEQFELKFVEPENLASDSKVRFEGIRLGDKVAIRSAQDLTVLAAPDRQTTGDQKTLVIMMRLGSSTKDLYTKAELEQIMFGSENSVNDFYRENSFGNVSFSGEVVGPFNIADPDQGKFCPYDQWSDRGDIAARAAGHDLSRFNSTIYVVDAYERCARGGVGELGGVKTRAWIFHSYEPRAFVFAHELGHNLGVDHASGLFCFDRAVENDPSKCYDDQYGDFHSVMGASFTLTHFNAPHKIAMGWIKPDEVRTVQAEGEHAILPLEQAGSGIKVLKLAIPGRTNQWYFIELRRRQGYDQRILNWLRTGVNVQIWNEQPQSRTYLVSYPVLRRTSAYREYSLQLKSSFIDDLNGLTITPVKLDADGATVNVKFSAQAGCSNFGPYLFLSPPSPISTGGSESTYQVRVRNATDCPGKTRFNLAASGSAIEQGWSVNFTPASLELDAGETGTAQLRVTIPPHSPDGDFEVVVKATSVADPDLQHSVAVSLSVPCARVRPMLRLEPPNQQVEPTDRFSLRYTLAVTNPATSRCGSLTFALNGTAPAGYQLSLAKQSVVVAPGATESLELTVTAKGAVNPGLYQLTTTATNSQDRSRSNQASATFEVKTVTVTPPPSPPPSPQPQQPREQPRQEKPPKPQVQAPNLPASGRVGPGQPLELRGKTVPNVNVRIEIY